MEREFLLITSPNNGGLIAIDGDELKIIDHASSTGLWIKSDSIIRSVQHENRSEIIVYHDDGSHQSFLNQKISDIHDLLFYKDKLYVVSTGTNEVVVLSPNGKIQKTYMFPGNGDAWHLNCLDIWDEKVVVSAFGEFFEHRGFKGKTLTKGFIFELESGLKVWENLSQPHSPKHYENVNYVCDSETKRLLIKENGNINEVHFEGYTRGLAVNEQYIYLGISKSRNIKVAHNCKIMVLEKETLNIVREIELPFNEVYDIRLVDASFLNKFDLSSPFLYVNELKNELMEKDNIIISQEKNIQEVSSWSIALNKEKNEKEEQIKLLTNQIQNQEDQIELKSKENRMQEEKRGLLEQQIESLSKENRMKEEKIALIEQQVKSELQKIDHFRQSMIKQEKMHETVKRTTDIQLHSLLQVDTELRRLQETKAWKALLLLRRVNHQLLKGTTAERKKFFKYVKNKLLKRPISKELEMSQFNPIQPVKINKFEENFLEAADSSHLEGGTSLFLEDIGFVKYNTSDGYDVFRFPVIDWDFRWQRPQQISVEFAKDGHRVFYISLDVDIISNENATFEEVSQKVIIKKLQKNVWGIKLCSYKRFDPYQDIITDSISMKYLQWSIQHVKHKFSIGQSISIIDLPFWAPLVNSIENTKIIYDCMDDHTGFNTNSTEMLSAEHQLIRSADLLVTTSQRLYENLKSENQLTKLIRNAGEYQHFSQRPIELAPELKNLKGYVIGYYGAIAEWFDIKLIENLAKRNREWTFVLVGNTFGCDISNVESLTNVIFTGEKPYSELPSYLYVFDLCLIPFIVNNLTLATNPVKVYEYLAAGKPIVSSKLPELEMLSDLVKTAGTYEEFESTIKQSLNEKNDKSINERKEFASRNTWHDRYLELKSTIDTNFFPKVSIVIVTYNNWSFTKQCLDSLFMNNDYPNTEIIVVDNASQDETRIQLSRIQKSNLKVILSPKNTGFAGGNKIGCQAATGEYIILLNNDTMVPKGWIERLIGPLKLNKDIGMVGPVSNSVGNDQTLDHFIGDPLNGPNELWLSYFYKFYKGRIRYTEMLGFYCVAMKREVYEKVGNLDIAFGIGMFEDDDYCERVKQHGYRLAIVEDAFVYHHGSVSFKKMEDAKYRALFEKNKMYFEKKWDKQWSMPNPPASIFFDAMDSETVTKKLKSVNRPKILVFGPKQWDSEAVRLQEIIFALSSEKEPPLIVTNIHHFMGEDVVGTRKAGPYLYITNRIDLFEKAHFDAILYCGDHEYHKEFHSNHVMIDRFSYPNDSSFNSIKHDVVIENKYQILEILNSKLAYKQV